MIVPINKGFEVNDVILVTRDTPYVMSGSMGVVVQPEGDGNWLVDFGVWGDEDEEPIELCMGEEEMIVVVETETDADEKEWYTC